VPLLGFAALEGMNGVQKFQIHRDDRSTDRLPSAHTWYVDSMERVWRMYRQRKKCKRVFVWDGDRTRDLQGGSSFCSTQFSFNQLDLPAYETYDKLRQMMLLAFRECSEGFGFA